MLVLARAWTDTTAHAKVSLADAFDVHSRLGRSTLGQRCLDSSTAIGDGNLE